MALNFCLRAVLGSKIKDITTSTLHLESNMPTIYQKFFQFAITFRKITTSGYPED
jgi:hypothetical protein